MSTIPQCHYAVLGIAPKASEDEIKKAYRKQSLQWHPDRNVGREEQANEMYIRIQEAHEVLTDANEKAWYDSNREALLRGDNDDNNIHLGAYFVSSCFRGFEGKFGFYNIYNDQFSEQTKLEMNVRGGGVQVPVPSTPKEKSTSKDTPKTVEKPIVRDIDDVDDMFSRYSIDDIDGVDDGNGNEEECGDDNYDDNDGIVPPAIGSIPIFGDINTPLSDVKKFYSFWLNFATYRNLGKDQWFVPDAENRRIKRQMIADNKKKRAIRKREFNELVRKLVSTVQKRDPRWKDIKSLELQEEHEKKRKAEEKKKVDEEMKRLNRARKAEEEAIRQEEQRQRYVELYGDDEDEDEDDDEEEEPEDEVEVYHCHECKKEFKSNGQLKQHCDSRKHKQQVAKLKKEGKKSTGSSDNGKVVSKPAADNKGDKQKDALRKQQQQEEEMFRRMFEEQMKLGSSQQKNK